MQDEWQNVTGEGAVLSFLKNIWSSKLLKYDGLNYEHILTNVN
jgi:hypothetical protein